MASKTRTARKELNAGKAQREAAQAKAEASAEESIKIATTAQVLTTSRKLDSLEKQGAEINRARRTAFDDGEKRNVNKDALKLAKRIRKAVEKNPRTYFHLLRYLDDLDVEVIAKQQADFFAEVHEPAPAAKRGNGRAAREVAESAGAGA